MNTIAERTRRRMQTLCRCPACSGPASGESANELFEFALESEEDSEVQRSSSAYIQWVQQALNRLLGAKLVVDGISGTLTKSAVRSFQSKKGLGVDGIVGPITEAALIAAGAGKPPGYSGTPSAPSPSPPSTWTPVPPGAGTLRERTAAVAAGEWESWQRGQLKENNPVVFERLVQYWMGVGYSRHDAEGRARLSQGEDPAGYWSAAFISWCVRQAGATEAQFSFAGAHSTFIAAAYQNRVQGNSKPFKAHSTSEAAPRVGDIVAYAREPGVPATVSTVKPDTSGYHTDIVIAIDSVAQKLTVVGGNLSDSVGSSTRDISSSGLLIHANPKYFGVIKVG